MFIGADVSHVVVSERKPSIAAVVASVSPTSTQYICRSSEQRPKTERKYSLEVIKDFQAMTRDLLHVFVQTNKQYPTKIVVYRDGVGKLNTKIRFFLSDNFLSLFRRRTFSETFRQRSSCSKKCLSRSVEFIVNRFHYEKIVFVRFQKFMEIVHNRK